VTQLTEARTTESFGKMVELVTSGGVLILSGAGLSTESGIPDYRGPTGLARQASGASPMTYQTFTGSAAARRRYWARSYLGWRHIARAVPNHGHRAVAELSRRGLLTGIITQNVDGLHQAAGASEVTELHGSLHRVRCLSCGQRTSRTELDRRLAAANPGWDAAAATVILPGRRLFRVPGRTQAGRGFLRRECPKAAGRGLLCAGRKSPRPARSRFLADRDVRVPLRSARGDAAAAHRDRESGSHPR
jgi:hypothetical protein